MAYELSDLLAAPSERRMAVGSPLLDEITGGIAAGSLWAFSGPAGVGVTALVNTIAAHVALSADVVVCNGHVPTRRLATNLAAQVGDQQPAGGRARLRLASWYRLLTEPPEDAIDGTLRPDLLVVDTWDEMWHTAPWPTTPSELVRSLRWLRYQAREHNTALLLTARIRESATGGTLAWLGEAFDDAADVRVRMHDDFQRHVDIRCRGGKVGRGRLRTGPEDRARIQREPTDPALAPLGATDS